MKRLMASRYAPDGDPCLVIRTARKAHWCRRCFRDIPPGATYIEYLGESAAYHSGPAYCEKCAKEDWQ